MKRLTVQVKDEVHRALKMLSLMEDKPLGRVVVEAIDVYLKQHGAYDFDIVRKPDP
jgi:predicted transcriptional regulator